MPSGTYLYMDIDIVIINNFDEEIAILMITCPQRPVYQMPFIGWVKNSAPQ